MDFSDVFKNFFEKSSANAPNIVFNCRFDEKIKQKALTLRHFFAIL